MTDDAIIRLLHDFWRKPLTNEFFQNNDRVVTEAFFSAPYPLIAQKLLRYPSASDCNDNEDKQDNDEVHDNENNINFEENTTDDNNIQIPLTQPEFAHLAT